MKKLIYLWIVASLLFATACSDDQEFVFSELPSERIQALQTECLTALKGADQGWKMVYYPMEEDYGGFTFMFRFKDKNRVDMISDFQIDVADYSYNLNLSESLVLTFDTYSPLHRLADPQYESPLEDGDKGYGLEGDFEFIVKEIKATEIILLGKKTRKELKLEKAVAEDWSEMDVLAKMAENFVLGDLGLGMTIQDELATGGNVEFDDIFHVCKISYKGEDGETVTVSSPYIIETEGCRFTKAMKVADVTFDGLTVDLSNGFANREFVSNDEAGAIRFFIMDLSPLDLTGDEVPAFVPNKYIASVDMLRANHSEYLITEMSSGLAAERDALKSELPNFIEFSLEIIPMDDSDYTKKGLKGIFHVTAFDSDGEEKTHKYKFGDFTMLDNTLNQVRFDDSVDSHSTSSGFKDKDLYAEKYNKHVEKIYDTFFAKDGFTVIRDTKNIFWIRSRTDAHVWMKLEAK